MTLLHDSPDPGYLIRLIRVYREKRQPVPVREEPNLAQIVQRKMPRRAAFQIARHQASQARRRA